ncbi:MAG TPA: acyl-CoA dehydrogenase family protein [Acidimicrobiales bacterium]|nr:acyl-CoA dehydrogenase family protein [Acidimicrobiales bacterium]
MRFDLTEEQAFFSETTRKFIQSRGALTATRDRWERPEGFDLPYWREAAELGWAAAFVPEDLGGGSVSGRPVQDAAIVAEEMGRMVAPGPFLAVNVVAAAIAEQGTAAQRAEWLPGIVSGEMVGSWAVEEDGATWSGTLPTVSATAEVERGELVLNGAKAYVEAAGQADLFLVTARTGGALSQLLLPADTPGLTVTPGRSIDLSRRFGRLHLDGVRLPASAVLGTPGEGTGAVERQLQIALALQCAETVGAAQQAFEVTIDYARDRFAFGRPIASFQALKHRIADMLQWIEFGKAISEAAAEAVDEGSEDAARLVSVAKAYVGDRCLDVVDECVQISGGIGVTWEHDVHLYSRRIALNRALFGSPEQHKERLCQLLER